MIALLGARMGNRDVMRVNLVEEGFHSYPRGKRPGPQPIEQFLQSKKSVITIQNLDELCCACALVAAKAYRDWGCRHWQYDNVRKGHPIQGQLARQLHRRARVPEGPCGIGELNLFQIVLADYQIVVVSADHAIRSSSKALTNPTTNCCVSSKSNTISMCATPWPGSLAKFTTVWNAKRVSTTMT